MPKRAKNILVGVDFSQGSHAALVMAVELAEAIRAELHIVHVFEPLTWVTSDTPHVYLDIQTRLEEERARQRDGFALLCARLVTKRVPYALHSVDGRPLDGLLAAISVLQPVLVVVGRHGHGAILQTLLGSLSAALCRRSPVPVVVVPPAEQVVAAERALGMAPSR